MHFTGNKGSSHCERKMAINRLLGPRGGPREKTERWPRARSPPPAPILELSVDSRSAFPLVEACQHQLPAQGPQVGGRVWSGAGGLRGKFMQVSWRQPGGGERPDIAGEGNPLCSLTAASPPQEERASRRPDGREGRLGHSWVLPGTERGGTDNLRWEPRTSREAPGPPLLSQPRGACSLVQR